jgi:E3 ubiquitin-protein ligase ZNF598
MEDCCAVCAEPLEWTAFGPCNHKDACSKCVARLRFVMADRRCVICQQQEPAVFVTRFMGAYTTSVLPEAFDDLKVCYSCMSVYLPRYCAVLLLSRASLGFAWLA